MSATEAELADLPRVDRLLELPQVRGLGLRRHVARAAAREVLEELRATLRSGTSPAGGLGVEAVGEAVATRLRNWVEPAPRKVINATGVLLHTNLGRAPLGSAAVEAMIEAAGSCDLEVELGSGRRGSRFAALRPLLRVVCEGEDAHVVTNGGAALLLACTALGAASKEALHGQGTAPVQRVGVVLGRGQMIEIGDGFRIADMAAAGGVPVIEVGATNRTHVRDYEAALEAGAGAILWAHASNFEQQGFVKQPPLEALAALARRHAVPLIADLGSGSLGGELPIEEPTIQRYLQAGADLVTCSGDKLLGGPQAGLMVGRSPFVERCRRHPMARALRPDKLVAAALHATLVEHARAEATDLPLHRMLRATQEELRERAQALLAAVGPPEAGEVRVGESEATVGGGALPGDRRASVALEVVGVDLRRAAKSLRTGRPPVFGRVEGGALWLDLRSVLPEDDDALAAALRAVLGT